MSDDYLHKEGRKLAQALPLYLSAQATLLLAAFLDNPAYTQEYLDQHNLLITPWIGLWFVLALFGLATGLILLVSQTWRATLDAGQRVQWAAGYLLGALAGCLALGLRFMPVLPPEYFYTIGGLAVLGAAAYLLWRRRFPREEEIFP